eukprot:12236274-Alexandrium_andersonii.AAC.1
MCTSQSCFRRASFGSSIAPIWRGLEVYIHFSPSCVCTQPRPCFAARARPTGRWARPEAFLPRRPACDPRPAVCSHGEQAARTSGDHVRS